MGVPRVRLYPAFSPRSQGKGNDVARSSLPRPPPRGCGIAALARGAVNRPAHRLSRYTRSEAGAARSFAQLRSWSTFSFIVFDNGTVLAAAQ